MRIDKPVIDSIELGNTSDTTITRNSAGVITVEGAVIPSISSTDTLTNKTLTGATNTVTAKLLKSATTEVDVSASAAPTTGQVLTATSDTTAAWQTPSGGSSDASVLLTNASYSFTTGRTSPTFTVELYDTDAFHDTSTNTSRIVIPSGKDGKYTFTGNFFTTGGIDAYGFGIQKNGALVQESKFYGAAAAPFGAGATIVYEDQAVATDYYELSIISSTARTGNFRFSARKFA